MTRFTRMIRISPTLILFLSVILFCSMMSSMVELNFAAMVSRESPDWTVYSIFVPRGIFVGSGVAVGRVWFGAGINMISPGRIGHSLGAKLLIANNTSKSTSYSIARSKQVSPSWMVYSNGPDGVGVIEGAGVSVMVGVKDGVAVGVTGVTVGVGLAVGVAEENNPIFGPLGPLNHTTNRTIPTITSSAARPHTKYGIILCRFL